MAEAVGNLCNRENNVVVGTKSNWKEELKRVLL